MYSFKDYLGITEGYTFFNDYYVSKMEQLERKYDAIENGTEFVETSMKLVTNKENLFIKFINKIKKILFGNTSEEKFNI